jgi:hypothetical protein
VFEKVGQVAEQVATNVSRRQFLRRLGGSAMIVAGGLAGVLALPQQAQAAKRCFRPNGFYQCGANEVCCFGFCIPRDRCIGG